MWGGFFCSIKNPGNGRMIRFRNPGSQYSTQVQVFKELFKRYGEADSFSLDQMAETITMTNLMTAYGYAGAQAYSLSQNEDRSRDTTYNNAKMYAEVFRLLGWVASADASHSYPLVFTYIGQHVANCETEDEALSLYKQCVLGINNPQETINVKFTEQVRFFKAALLSFLELDNIMYKHELCYGPMSVNDTDPEDWKRMISYVKSIRGSYSRYCNAYEKLCDDLNVKETLPDNSTRLPVAMMQTCGWVEKAKKTNKLFPPKSLDCMSITQKGIEVARYLRSLKDLRLDEFHSYSALQQESLIRLGVFSMLKRAGYDTSRYSNIINDDSNRCSSILEGKELLFSPYQTIQHETVDDALGIVRSSNIILKPHIAATKTARRTSDVMDLHNTEAFTSGNADSDEEMAVITHRVETRFKQGESKDSIIDSEFKEMINATQTVFYPYVATLFRILGFNCRASRAGDNGARWDAIIMDEEESIPIEIKSPTEEQHLSLKAIRQALENKIVLLSREIHHTKERTTSLAVGYYLPNDRAEVSILIDDFYAAYGFSIGVIDLKTLLVMAVNSIIDKKTINKEQLYTLRGFANGFID